jgi:hypothetical protein
MRSVYNATNDIIESVHNASLLSQLPEFFYSFYDQTCVTHVVPVDSRVLYLL